METINVDANSVNGITDTDNDEVINTNIALVIKAVNYLQAKNKGRYFDNVFDHC